MKRQMENFSFSPPINLIKEEKWLLAVTSFDTMNSIFKITNEDNSFSVSIPGYWNSEEGEELFNELLKLLELRSENDIELQVRDVEKRGTRLEIESGGYNLASFDHFKSEILSESKRVKHRDLEDKVSRLELTYDEIVDFLSNKLPAQQRDKHYRSAYTKLLLII